MNLDRDEARAREIGDLLAALGIIRHRRFFGGLGLECHRVQFAILMKGKLYLRCDAAMATELERMGSAPFRYDTRRGPVTVAAYWTAPLEALEDPDALRRWARRSLARAH